MSVEVKRIHKLGSDSTIAAFCDVIFHGNILIKGLKVVRGKDGLFAALPSNQSKDGKWFQTVGILDNDLFEETKQVVLEAYLADGGEGEIAPPHGGDYEGEVRPRERKAKPLAKDQVRSAAPAPAQAPEQRPAAAPAPAPEREPGQDDEENIF